MHKENCLIDILLWETLYNKLDIKTDVLSLLVISQK